MVRTRSTRLEVCLLAIYDQIDHGTPSQCISKKLLYTIQLVGWIDTMVAYTCQLKPLCFVPATR